MKTCKKCGLERAAYERCGACRKAYASSPERRQKNREKYALNAETKRATFKRWYAANKDKERVRHLMKDFGITLDQYMKMEKMQDGACAICKLASLDRLCVDHDHESGEVRGLLCRTCNAAIGLFKEDLKIVEAAVSYLSGSKMPNRAGSSITWADPA